MALSPAIVRKDGLVLVGSQNGIDHSDSSTPITNVLLLTNYNSLMDDFPVQIPMPHPIRDIQWLNATTAVIAAGPSLLLAKINDTRRDAPIEPQWIDSTMGHSDAIRQVAPSLTSGRDILSGGTLNLITHIFVEYPRQNYDSSIFRI